MQGAKGRYLALGFLLLAAGARSYAIEKNTYSEPSPGSPLQPINAPTPATFSDNSKQWILNFSGFIESDLFYDTTRSLIESIGDSPVDRPSTVAGSNGRTQLSIRNSRMAFGLDAPVFEGWKSRAYFENDFLGFVPAPGAGVTEAQFFSNPTFRMRHGYFQAVKNDFTILVGQTWSLLGWQPFYFLSSVEVQPVSAMLYTRIAQIRALKIFKLNSDFQIQTAVAVQRPPQRDSALPDLHAGVRFVYNGRKSGLTRGSSGPLQPEPMSLGLSAAFREYEIPAAGPTAPVMVNFPGYAYAINVMLPVIAAKSSTDSGNTLTLAAEYTSGRGNGDQYLGWTGNLSSSVATGGSQPSQQLNLDGNIGSYDSKGNFSLINLSSFNLQLQYHLPTEYATWFTAGLGQLYSNNMLGRVPAAGLVPYNREQVAFFNVAHSFTDHIRVGVEYSFLRTTYIDGDFASNNRYQLTTLFVF